MLQNTSRWPIIYFRSVRIIKFRIAFLTAKGRVRLRASSKKGPISYSFLTLMVEKFQRYSELGLPIRVHLRMDARSESGADFFTC